MRLTIAKEDLAGKAGLDLALLLDKSSELQPAEYTTPKFIDSKCTLMKRGKEWVITASGGVEINSWSVIEKVEDSAEVGKLREKAAGKQGKSVWWN